MTRTRVVRWLQVLLPLLALVMLSTMFLFNRSSDSESRIPYAEVESQASSRTDRILAPEYNAVTRDNVQITLRANMATPGAGGGMAGDVALDWLRPDGLRADLTAPEGELRSGVVVLDGGVHMTTSSGWVVDAKTVQVRTDSSLIEANEGVEAKAPFGYLTAGQMQLTPNGDASVLNFSDGVRLIYQPAGPDAATP